MHDGKVVEDEHLEERLFPRAVPAGEAAGSRKSRAPAGAGSYAGTISAASKLRLGIRNTFNILPKFLLLLVVFLFVVLAVCVEYTTFHYSDAEAAKLGYNDYFFQL